VWKPILDRTTFEQVRAILLDPARRTNRSARRYLLTGLLRCSECGEVMVCRYATDWAAIKKKWSLTATQPEYDSLLSMLTIC
jgi:hypothetical protein